MAGALNTIFSVCNQVLQTLIQNLTVGTTGADIFAAGEAPRIVWTPVFERFGGPTGQGGDGITNPKALRDRMVHVDVRIWGQDRDAVEQYQSLIASTLNDVVGAANFDVIEAEWLDTEAVGKSGDAMRLQVSLRVPLVHTTDQTAVIRSFSYTPTVNAYAG